MSILVTIDDISNGTPPYEIYICEELNSQNCCFLGTYDPSTDTLPLEFLVNDPVCTLFTDPVLRFIDSANPACDIYLDDSTSYTFTISINNTGYYVPNVPSTGPYSFIYNNNGILTSVNWNNGVNISQYDTNTPQTASHQYTGPFTGEIVISSSTNFSEFTFLNTTTSGIPITSANTIQSFFYTTEMAKLTSLEEYINMFGLLRFSGFVSDFPQSLKKIQVNVFNLSGNYSQLPNNMEYIHFESANASNSSKSNVTGSTSQLPRSLQYFSNIGGGTDFSLNSIDGLFSGLPPGLLEMRIGSDNSSIIDNISNIPNSVKYFGHVGAASSNSNYFGDVSGISTKPLEYFNIFFQNNTISGNIINLPRTLTHFSVGGQNTLTGNIKDAPPNITQSLGYDGNFPRDRGLFVVGGQNTIFGTTSDFPFTGTDYGIDISGNNTISGPLSLSHLTGNNIIIRIFGDNTIGPPTTTPVVPQGLSELSITQNGGNGVQTGNTISGDVSLFINNSMITFSIAGANTISGNITDIPSGSLVTFNLYGFNTLTGSILDIPSPIRFFRVHGNNTISGNISNISNNLLEVVDIIGNNTISGSLDFSLPNCYFLRVFGNNTINANNISFNLRSPLSGIEIVGLNQFTTTQTDAILIYIASNFQFGGVVGRTVKLKSAGRTSASDMAFNTITGSPNNAIVQLIP